MRPYDKRSPTTRWLRQRRFDQGEPEKVFLTDITYLRYGTSQWAYLSCVKDGATRQILADYVSPTLELPLVERIFQQLVERLDGNLHPEVILHSDQGMHYTHPSTRSFLAEAGFKQSMSRRGNCWDNASMESFFGHMDFTDCQTIEQVRVRVKEYIIYFNSERY